MTRRRPNILLITSDQQRGDCFGFEGRRVRTPHLDQLAAEGTRFSACITPNVVCQPSRATMLTGLLPLTHGVGDNGIDLDPAVGERGFAGTLARSGYRTGLIGKAHFSTSHTFAATGTPECRTSSANYGPGWFGPYMGFEHVELMLEGHNQWPPMEPPRGQHYERWYHQDGRGTERTALYSTRLAPLSTAAQTWHSALPVAWHNSTWIGDRTIEFLRQHAADAGAAGDGGADQPFCLWASFPDPHHPFDAPEPWSRLHHPDDVDLPAERTLDLERRPWWHRASLTATPQIAGHLRAERERFSRIPVQTDQELRELIANYYGMISLIDHNVGRILISLQELDLARDTIVIYTTDHGDWLGDHGLLLKGPMMYEGLLRVGFIINGPGIPGATVVSDPVATTDLAATLCDLAGAPMDPAWHSQSLLPLIAGGQTRDFAYNEWDLRSSRCGVELKLRVARTRRHKLTVDLISGAGELYDLQDDPHEMQNRFDDDSHRSVRAELLDMIRSRPQDARTEELPQVGMA